MYKEAAHLIQFFPSHMSSPLTPPPPNQLMVPTAGGANAELARAKRKVVSLQDALDKATGQKKQNAYVCSPLVL